MDANGFYEWIEFQANAELFRSNAGLESTHEGMKRIRHDRYLRYSQGNDANQAVAGVYSDSGRRG